MGRDLRKQAERQCRARVGTQFRLESVSHESLGELNQPLVLCRSVFKLEGRENNFFIIRVTKLNYTQKVWFVSSIGFGLRFREMIEKISRGAMELHTNSVQNRY